MSANRMYFFEYDDPKDEEKIVQKYVHRRHDAVTQAKNENAHVVKKVMLRADAFEMLMNGAKPEEVIVQSDIAWINPLDPEKV